MALPLVAIPVIGELVKAGLAIIDKFVPDKEQAAKMQHELLLKEAELQKQYPEVASKESSDQAAINKAEAASGNWYAAGWRPTLGYVCVLGFAYNFLGYPMLQWYTATHAVSYTIPPLISDNLVELTFGMLGLGMMRTYEKIKGTAK